MAIQSIYVEKRTPYAVEARSTLSDLETVLRAPGLRSVRVVNRYFVEGMAPEDFAEAKNGIFAEPVVDKLYDQMPDPGQSWVFAVEYLPGQFDQRADSCAQCVALATGGERPLVRTAKLYYLDGKLTEQSFQAIKDYLINPVECREASLEVPASLAVDYPDPDPVPVVEGFLQAGEQDLRDLLEALSLAMDLSDLKFCQKYFREQENRDPTLTEIRMIDTYWSDHCRHTTFLTHLDQVTADADYIRVAWWTYQDIREKLGLTDKPVTLMDLAVIGAKELKNQGYLRELDESEEINACSVKIKVDVDSPETGRREQDWLLMFKNETHNHPTEIEPFGGAATCLGGAIRDPLSGRSYVYQAMRVTGAGDPLTDAADTFPGKLPQRKIVTTAAAGYSSYGNQIGLATGHVHEIYHPGYVAKRMEIGAVLGAAPAKNVVRRKPRPGDLVILLGGRTGRDGCGGATGSSKSHTAASLETCGAEVQKGNPPEERKLQRLFRNPEAARLIRRCNDFGAGGVSVSIGELADGVHIDLDAIPKKYEGLNGTELAISESQERMSVVVAKGDAERFIQLAAAENLEATVVARITKEPRLTMDWRGDRIVDVSRDFLDSNGAAKRASVHIPDPDFVPDEPVPVDGKALKKLLSSLACCSQKGLVERFDSTIGAGTILMPFGGKRQLTPAQAMAAKIPVLGGETNTCSVMAWGFDPELTSRSPYHGGQAAVIHSVAKVIAAGGSRERCWLTFQEYFERLGDDPERWGKPTAALLGALMAQLELKVAAIGGKDSMSGTFERLDVPPTLVSFAVSTTKTRQVMSPEFKAADSKVYLFKPTFREHSVPRYEDLRELFTMVEGLIAEGRVRAAWAVGQGGVAEGVAKMCFGNRIGFRAIQPLDTVSDYGGFILEAEELPGWERCLLGETVDLYQLTLAGGETVDLEELESAWEETLSPVFPSWILQEGPLPGLRENVAPSRTMMTRHELVYSPRVIIPVFPGANCEDDTARAFRLAGGDPHVLVIRNRTPDEIVESVRALRDEIREAQIIAIPGGFSGGDEPDGSAKFIVSVFRNPLIADEVTRLLEERDGLILGICNGFQALIKLGLLPFGRILPMEAGSPTLTYNTIGRHQSMLVRTRVVSNRSPWLCRFPEGSTFTIPVSHGEGRFVADRELADQFFQNGQIATVYVDQAGMPTQDARYNPNNSVYAVEGICSPDGRVFGKMGHNERFGEGLYRNVPGNTVMNIFQNGVEYFR